MLHSKNTPPLYKHYSFDLWMTLIRSNPSFKTERAKFFYKHFNGLHKSMEEITAIFRQVDLMCNAINEKTGKNIDADEMYLMVISQMNNHATNFTDIDLNWLYSEMDSLLFQYMPMVYCNNTLDTLDRLKQKNKGSFNISSNTAFVKGSSLRTVLSELGLSPYFEFQLYSDEIGFSKPNKSFFDLMIDTSKSIRANTAMEHKDILHIGDNPNADINGALAAGIHAIQINSNHQTIAALLH